MVAISGRTSYPVITQRVALTFPQPEGGIFSTWRQLFSWSSWQQRDTDRWQSEWKHPWKRNGEMREDRYMSISSFIAQLCNVPIYICLVSIELTETLPCVYIPPPNNTALDETKCTKYEHIHVHIESIIDCRHRLAVGQRDKLFCTCVWLLPLIYMQSKLYL